MNVAVILAGGVGSRLGNETPKQFFKVAGKTIIEHSIDAFEHHAGIDEIAVVVHPLFLLKIEELILANNWLKVKKILKGGSERYDSSLVAIKAYASQKDTRLIFHDAVRPLVSQRIITDVIAALNTHKAIDVAVPATDTIVEVNEQGEYISSIPNRKLLRRGQTPQAFHIETITKAYEIGLKDPNFISTDDCGVVVRYLPQEKVYVVLGEESNIKLTYKEDVYILDKLFQLRSTELQNQCDFNTLNNKVMVVFGGSSGIGESVVNEAKQYGAKVYSFSRSENNTDITIRQQVSKALKSVFEKEGRIDFVVNSAAVLYKQTFNSMSAVDIENIIAINYTGMVNVAIESYPYLSKTQGHMLFYTSSSYTRGRAFYALYSSTKAAVVNFVQALAQEWEGEGICINAINPERTKTPMRTHNFGIEPEHTLLDAKTVARDSIKTLLSNITGQVIDVKINK